jgi:hypothetical protein
MTGDVEKKWERLKELQAELKRLQEELKQGLSRRNFLGRLKGAGVGFGAAFVLGVDKAAALSEPDAGVSVKSTNPAVDEILAEGAKDQMIEGAQDPAGKVDPNDPMTHKAWYRRFFRRFYRRGYRRFFYRRFFYRRFYRRGYRRFYRRFYRRW